jgi:hypothetical protein
LFNRKTPDGAAKIVRLHNTESNIMDNLEATIVNLLDIGLYRSVMDPTSRDHYTSPLIETVDGFFSLGYDMILVPLAVDAGSFGKSAYSLIGIINPVANYDAWIDIAVVGSYQTDNALSQIIDYHVKNMVYDYAVDNMVCDHHANDPGSFGFGTTVPESIAAAKGVARMVSDKISDLLDWTGEGFISKLYLSMSSKNDSVLIGPEFDAQLAFQHDILAQRDTPYDVVQPHLLGLLTPEISNERSDSSTLASRALESAKNVATSPRDVGILLSKGANSARDAGLIKSTYSLPDIINQNRASISA